MRIFQAVLTALAIVFVMGAGYYAHENLVLAQCTAGIQIATALGSSVQLSPSLGDACRSLIVAPK